MHITPGNLRIRRNITGLNRTDTFYATEEKSLNMEQFEAPHAERYYTGSDERQHEEEITLSESRTQGTTSPLEDWATPTYSLENTEKVTFNNMLKEKDLEVEKEWKDNKDHSGDSITFTVNAKAYKEGETAVDYVVDALKASPSSTSNDKKIYAECR